MKVKLLSTAEEIQAAYPVMEQLRPLIPAADFTPRVLQQMQDGYRLAGVIDNDQITCLAGYRIQENLAMGRHLYVDDLVTKESTRSKGHGKAMMDWLKKEARDAGCGQLHLDSGSQRHLAHRFYFREGLLIHSYHFAMAL